MTRNPCSAAASGALLLAVLGAACGGTGADVAETGDDSRIPPPAAALSREAGVGLGERLAQLDADLTAVLDSDLDDESEADLLAAEATTDRLLEEEPGDDWLASGYLVEARLRQLQALADRIVAEARRGVAKELILEDIAALRAAVRDLRTQLTNTGNGAAPTPLDSLLARAGAERSGPGRAAASPAEPATATAQPAPATTAADDGLLGRPVTP